MSLENSFAACSNNIQIDLNMTPAQSTLCIYKVYNIAKYASDAHLKIICASSNYQEQILSDLPF